MGQRQFRSDDTSTWTDKFGSGSDVYTLGLGDTNHYFSGQEDENSV